MSVNERQQRLLAQTREELQGWGDRPVLWQMSMPDAIRLCGALQLALRHPQFASGPSAEQVRRHITAFIAAIPDDFPGIKETLARGFHPKFDR